MARTDITGDIGPLYGDDTHARTIPMFSFDSPALSFWQGVYDLLRERGLTHENAAEWLQSKHARWLFEARGEDVRALGRYAAQLYVSRNGTEI